MNSTAAATSDPLQIPLPDQGTLNETLGAILVGGVVASVLYGISCLQCFIFFQRQTKKQLPLLNTSVWLIWVLDTVHLAVFVGYTLWWYMVKNFGNTAALGELPWSLPCGIVLTTISDGIVRFWFTYRLWILSKKKKWLTFPVLVMQISLWIIALVSGIRGFWLHTFERFGEISGLLYSTIGLIIASDFTIAGSLCYFLYQSRRGTFSRKTRSVIDVLIIYTINTGLLTSIVATITLVLYITLPATYCFLGVYYLLEKLFANSFLASLNARDWINSESGTPITLSLSPMSKGNNSSGRPVGVHKQTDSQISDPSTADVELGVRVHTEKTDAII